MGVKLITLKVSLLKFSPSFEVLTCQHLMSNIGVTKNTEVNKTEWRMWRVFGLRLFKKKLVFTFDHIVVRWFCLASSDFGILLLFSAANFNCKGRHLVFLTNRPDRLNEQWFSLAGDFVYAWVTRNTKLPFQIIAGLK